MESKEVMVWSDTNIYLRDHEEVFQLTPLCPGGESQDCRFEKKIVFPETKRETRFVIVGSSGSDKVYFRFPEWVTIERIPTPNRVADTNLGIGVIAFLFWGLVAFGVAAVIDESS